jgi:ubiquinone/menaquinone biosynthesis C-methylase UbiE
MTVTLATPREKPFWQFVYDNLAAIQRDDWSFMNYGYASLRDDAAFVELAKEEEKDRYPIQMYHYVATAVSVREKYVLEVGSGRGGGACYVAKRLGPKKVTAIELSGDAVAFCKRRHSAPNLDFQCGDAQNLPFDDNTFDVVISVESSHCYENFSKFADEVERVLKSSGLLSICDIRFQKNSVDAVREAFRQSALVLLSESDISANVLRALDQVSASKEQLIDGIQEVPMELKRTLKNFAGVVHGRNYRAIKDGKYPYFHWVLRKE